MTEYQLGHIASVPVGSVFHTRKEVREAGLHRHLINGIDGDERVTRSLVAAGVYNADSDKGVTLWYAGQGGLDRDTGLQTDHQRFEGPNAGLAASMASGMAIRLIRGWGPKKGAKVYRYDGLYRVTRYWLEQGRNFNVCMYQLDAVISDLGYPFEPDLDDQGRPFPVIPRNFGKLPMLTYERANQVTQHRLAQLQRTDWKCEVCSAGQDVAKRQLLRVTPKGVLAAAPYTADQGNVLCTFCFSDYLRKKPTLLAQ